MSEPRPRVALLVTCLVDLFRPSVGFAAVRLLEDAGCDVEVPAQSCCGQPAYNSGERHLAMKVARTMLDALEPYDYVVAPSGSCTGMVTRHYPALFEGTRDEERARALARRTFELTRFLVEIRGVTTTGSRFDGMVTWHDSCSCLREAGTREAPRTLLRTVEGTVLKEAGDREVCCGFGGTFAVKYPAISTAMAEDKAARLEETGADTVLSADLGCLLNIAGVLRRQGSPMKVRHVAEVLADDTAGPAIGEPDP
ncbi:MAG: (Fe-S)-binding protein [bacterium]|nr:(Fe-S)-binding protein [bacterium]MDE0239496.1 (Fe-S)-binding protein [bacterium]MDE0417269.1 (Fe-S)-binding protein [bacterium]